MPLVARAITTPEPSIVIHTPGTALEANRGIVLKPDTSGSEAKAVTQLPDTSGISALSEEEMLDYIEQKESKGNHLAQNPRSTAFGRFQFLNSTWATVGCVKTSDPIEQERCAIKYMEERYGGIEGAYYFHKRMGWY